MLSRLVAAVFAVALAAPAQSPPEAQAAILEQVRNYALNYSHNLPDYICTQVTNRYTAPTPGGQYAAREAGARWELQDVLTIRLTYFEEKEHYQLERVNDKAAGKNYTQLGGTVTAGDFGTMMRQLFEPATEAHFQWDRIEKFRGRRAYVFAYQVSQARSRWHIEYQHRADVITSYRDLIHIDPDSHQVLRISLEAVDLPHGYVVRHAETTLDYDYQVLDNQKFLLPSKSEVLMTSYDWLTRNENEFRRYHKYASESAIRYDNQPEAEPVRK